MMTFQQFYKMYQTNPTLAEQSLQREVRDKPHAHKCPSPECGLVWSHAASDASNQEEHDALHRCPMCNTPEYERWDVEHGMFTRDVEKLECK